MKDSTTKIGSNMDMYYTESKMASDYDDMELDTYKGSRKPGKCCCKCYNDNHHSCLDPGFGVYDLIPQEGEGSEIMDFETT